MALLRILILSPVLAVSLAAAELTTAEVARIQTDLGITLSAQEKSQLAAIVKPEGPVPQWRLDAEARIEQHRMADLEIRVEDIDGKVVPGAQVQARMRSNAFHFGGVMNVKDFNNEGNVLGISTDRYREIFLKLFNAGGLDNGFKPKQRAGNEHLLPGFISWAKASELPIRGHTLIWPGTPDNNHLPNDILADVVAVEQAIASNEPLATVNALKGTLKTNVDAMIAEWASLWDVYEWDVINETLSNYRVQELLGYDQMAEWFKIARANAVQPDCNLVLNEFQIISARTDSLDYGHYWQRSSQFKANIDRILADGGPLTKIGFQSRIKFEHRDPQIIYDRLEDFGQAYGLPMVGTEFEVRDSDPGSNFYPYEYTEYQRAQITAEMLTQYYSHPLVEGLFAWTYMKPENYALCHMDGAIKLNALVWYYLHRIHYNTSTGGLTNATGSIRLRGHKGLYDVTALVDGKEYAAEITLREDQSVTITVDKLVNDGHWGVFPINEDNYVDTGYWLGWLQVEHNPWIWSHRLQNWVLIPPQSAMDGEGWIFIVHI